MLHRGEIAYILIQTPPGLAHGLTISLMKDVRDRRFCYRADPSDVGSFSDAFALTWRFA
jgi:hypothetical protein